MQRKKGKCVNYLVYQLTQIGMIYYICMALKKTPTLRFKDEAMKTLRKQEGFL